MLRLFRNNSFGGIAAVVVFTLVYRGLQLFFAPAVTPVYIGDGLYVQGWIDALHQTQNGLYISMGISFVLCLGMGFIFNALVNQYEVLFRPSYFPALFFFYFTHMFPGQGLLSPHLLAAVFVFLQLYRYLSLNPAKVLGTPFLDIGMFGGIAFFITPDSLFFIPALIIALAISGYLSFKTISFYVTGFALPVYFTGLVYYLTDSWSAFSSYFIYTHVGFSPARFMLPWQYLSVAGFILVILLISSSGILSNFGKNTIRSRSLQQGLLLFLVGALVALVASLAPAYQAFTLLALPLTPFIAYYFLKTKKPLIRETLFALFFIISIIASIAFQNG